MSYSAEIKFKKNIKTIKEFLDFTEQIKDTLKITDLSNFHYDLIRKCYREEEDSSNIFMLVKEFSNTSLILCYWEEYDLIGLLSLAPLNSLDSLFDGSFFFQDSTDQDYSLDEYNIFPERLKSDVLEFPNNDFEEWLDFFEEKDSEERKEYYDYYKLSYSYHLLVHKLNLYDEFLIPINKTIKSKIGAKNTLIIQPFGRKKFDYKFHEEIKKLVRKKSLIC